MKSIDNLNNIYEFSDNNSINNNQSITVNNEKLQSFDIIQEKNTDNNEQQNNFLKNLKMKLIFAIGIFILIIIVLIIVFAKKDNSKDNSEPICSNSQIEDPNLNDDFNQDEFITL